LVLPNQSYRDGGVPQHAGVVGGPKIVETGAADRKNYTKRRKALAHLLNEEKKGNT